MYGSIFYMTVKPGLTAKVIDIFNDWERERQPQAPGAIGGLVMKPDHGSDILIGVAVFADKATYVANGQAPEQDAWFRKLRDCLEADPKWMDGEYVAGRLSS